MSDETLRKQMTETIAGILDDRWTEVDEMWMREIKPILGVQISDEDFIKRIANPLTMRLLSIGIQAGIRGITDHAQVFEKPFRFVVAPSGAVSIRFLEE
ncbi:hypothetical protein AYO38_04905 [bacterium SCGC AG-212-C10]|nr:hypothetical protein AYO38_04905 [bacterium SCGC AG-212-C10]